MKKCWLRYLAAGLVGAILVISFLWVSHLIQERKVYHLSVLTLLSSYKEDSLVFKRKYDKHIVYLTGKVFYVAKQDPGNYVLLMGTEYIGSYVELIDSSFKIDKTTKDVDGCSIRCGINNEELKEFEFMDYTSENIITIKGTLHVNTTEVVLKDCIKVVN